MLKFAISGKGGIKLSIESCTDNRWQDRYPSNETLRLETVKSTNSRTEPSCSKLITSLVNEMLKFQTYIKTLPFFPENI